MLFKEGRNGPENPKIGFIQNLNPLRYDQRTYDGKGGCLRTEKQDSKIRSSEHQIISPIEYTTVSSQQEHEEMRNVCPPLDVSFKPDVSENENLVSVDDTLFKGKHVLTSCVTFTPQYGEKEYGGMSSKLLLRISDQETNHNNENANTPYNNSALRDDKNKDVSQGLVEPQSSTCHDHSYHRHRHTEKYLKNTHFYDSETCSALKTVTVRSNIDRKKINYVESESIQSHHRSDDEKQRKSDDLTIVLSGVNREVAQYVAPSRTIHDNCKTNLDVVSEGVETRSLQYQSDLHDPTLLRDFPPLCRKVNAMPRNAWSSEALVSDRVENSTDAFLNLGRLCAAEREDLEPSPVEGKPGKYTPAAAGVQPTSRNLKKSASGESNDWKKCNSPLTTAITSCSITSSSQIEKDRIVDKVTTDVITASASASVETNNPRRSLTRVTSRRETCANAPSHILVKNNLLAFSLPDVSNVLFTVTNKTEKLCGLSCQKISKLLDASFDDAFLVISNFHRFKHLRRSHSEPALLFQIPYVYVNPNKGDVKTEKEISRKLIEEKQGNNLKHLQDSCNNMAEKYLCSDTDNVGIDCSFENCDKSGQMPPKSSKDKQLQIKQPKYREFSSLKMSNIAKSFQREEELAQEPISVGRQVVQVHASVVPSFTKSIVKLPSGLTKPKPPPKPARLLTIGKARQVRPPNLITEGSSFKYSGSISINTNSTVTLADVNNRLLSPSNINKVSDVTTWKYGGETSRPKAVTIVIPTDKVENDNVNIVTLTPEPEHKCLKENETELPNPNFVIPLEEQKPPCNQRSVIKMHSQTRRSKENEDKLSCIENRCGRSVTPEYPSLIHAEKKLSLPSSSHNYISSSLTSTHSKTQERQGFISSRNKVERNFNYLLNLKPVAECQKPRNPTSLSPLSSPLPQEGFADRIERITGFKSATKGNATKPPLPPQLQNVGCDRTHFGIKGRIAVARKQFLDTVQSSEGIVSDNVSQDVNKERFKSFRRSTEVERARLIGSTPNLVALERSARSSRRHIDRILATKGPSQQESSAERSSSEPHRHTGDSNVVWPSYNQKLAQYKERCELEKTLRRRSKSLGYLETDIDTLECRQVCETDLDSSSQENSLNNESHAHSMLTLGDQGQIHFASGMEDNSRARSMDFLLDDDNRLAALPPENTLNTNKTKSEHELRIERSLQNLNVPEWYRTSPWSKLSQERTLLKRDEGTQRPRWEGLGSRTTSSSSLASTSFSGRNLTTPDQMNTADWRYMGSFRSSRESLTGASTDSVSPADSYSLSRWSSSRLSSTSAPVSGWPAYRSFKQPYLGWRAAAGLSPGSNLSEAPSPALSTPVTTSRPVSPGRSLGEGHVATSHLMDKPETHTSPHSQIVKNVEKSSFFTNLNEQLSKYGHFTDILEQISDHTRPEQAPPPTNHPKGDTEARNSQSGSLEKASLSSSYIRKVSQNSSGSTDNGSPHYQIRNSDENDSTFRNSLIRLYDSLVKSSEPINVSVSVSDPSNSLYQTFITDSPVRENSYQEYSKQRNSQEKDISLSQQIPIIHNSPWKCSVDNGTDHSQSAYLNEKEKEENLKVITTNLDSQVVSSRLLQENDEPQVVSSRLPQENDDPQVVSSKLPQENSEKRKNVLNGYRGEIEMALEEPDTLPTFIKQNIHDKFESPHERDREEDTFSYIQIQSICSGDSIIDKESEKDTSTTSPNVPHSSSNTNQNQNSSSPQHVMWMESSFVGSRPTTSVVVMPSNESPAETASEICNVDGDKDSVQNHNGLNNLEEETEDITTSLDDVLDSSLDIPFSSLSSNPGASRYDSPSVTQMISSVAVSQEVSVTFDVGCTEKIEPYQKTSTDVRSHPTTLSRSRAGFQQSPCRKLSEAIFIGSGTRDDNVFSSTVVTSLEPDFGQSSREDAEEKLKEAMSQENKKYTFPEQEEDKTGDQQVYNIFKVTPTLPDTRHGFPESNHNTEETSVLSHMDDTQYESSQHQVSITCNRSKCTKTLPAEEARTKFRMCPNCYTYYCSRHCRKLDWERHKNQCPYTKVGNLCQKVLIKVRQDPVSRRNLSVCARRGYLSRGRGAVKLVFYNTEGALDFMCKGWESIRRQNVYVPLGDLLPQEMGADMYTHVRSLCDHYNPGKKFVLLVAVRVTQDVSSVAGAVVEREIIIRGTKVRLAPPLPEDDVQTVILTLAKDPGSDVTERLQQCLAMEHHLQERGINLATEFPDMYAKIRIFVEKGNPFLPFSMFLTDQKTAKMFMCIILPWADADIIQNISAKAAVTTSRQLWML